MAKNQALALAIAANADRLEQPLRLNGPRKALDPCGVEVAFAIVATSIEASGSSVMSIFGSCIGSPCPRAGRA
jgi:hypothetical protein